jgi:predicted negative regulator of RcsB-dependent stress response
MIDSSPISEWSDSVAAFWTFWSENGTGTYVMTALGVALMVASLWYWVWLEARKLNAQAALLRAAGGLPAPGGKPGGAGP